MEYLFQDSDFCKKYHSTSYTQYIQKCNWIPLISFQCSFASPREGLRDDLNNGYIEAIHLNSYMSAILVIFHCAYCTDACVANLFFYDSHYSPHTRTQTPSRYPKRPCALWALISSSVYRAQQFIFIDHVVYSHDHKFWSSVEVIRRNKLLVTCWFKGLKTVLNLVMEFRNLESSWYCW